MCRRPEPGRTKTRLQSRLSPEEAAAVAQGLLTDTIARLRTLDSIEVVLAVDRAESVAWFAELAPDLPTVVQDGDGLGARLDRVLGDLLDRGHPVAVAVGADSPLLDPTEVERAVKLVADGTDAVFGPTDDGGYYLIASAHRPGPLVTDVTMSTPQVLADTLDVAAALDRSVALVGRCYDVDEPEDLDRLAADLAVRPDDHAPATRAVLASLPPGAVRSPASSTTTATTPGSKTSPTSSTTAATTTGSAPGSAAARTPGSKTAATSGSAPGSKTDARPAMVAVVIPALNEETAIADVVHRCRAQVNGPVVVVDNGSTDATAERAAAAEALVVSEPRQGYGQACAAGVAAAAEAGADIVAFVDGDASSPPEELAAIVDPVVAGEADLVQGSRATGSIAEGAMSAHQRWGNAFAAWLLRRLYGLEVTDLGPFRAIRLDLLHDMGMTEMTYGWPTEMTVKAANEGARITEVPVSWLPRTGGRSKVSGTVRGSVLAARYIVGVTLRHSRPGAAVAERWRRLRRR